MWRLILWFLVAAALAWGLTWLAEHPGTITIEWLGWRVEELPVSLALAALLLALLAAWLVLRLLRWIIGAPFAVGDFLRLRRRKKAAQAMTTGLVALLAGDADNARKAAQKAARLAPADPLARLLQAQGALAAGDVRHAEYLFRQLIDDPDTEPAALRGLYELATKNGDPAAALAIAARANERHPHLEWAARALLRAATRAGKWEEALEVLRRMKRAGLIAGERLDRKQAALLAAQALALEESEPEKALQLALRAHRLDAGLTPAALVAARLLSRQGKVRRAAKVLQAAWKRRPHPDIAEVHAYLRAGDSPSDRLARVKQLLRGAAGGEDGAVALARAAIDARDWETALGALRPWLGENPSARIFLLMAELEEARSGDIGRMREWLRRARQARPGPAWVAGDVISPVWLPATPEGEPGVFEWKEPPRLAQAAARLEPVPSELLEPPARVARDDMDADARTAQDSARQAREAGVVKITTASETTPEHEGGGERDDKADDGQGSEPDDTHGRTDAASREEAGPEKAREDDIHAPGPATPPRGAEAVAELAESDSPAAPPLPDDPGVSAPRRS